MAIAAIRYVLLFVCFLFLYLAGLRWFRDGAYAALAVFGFALIYLFGFYVHQDLTHTPAMAAALAGSFYAFTRLSEKPSLVRYGALGLVCGLGALGKWSFLIAAAAAMLACVVDRRFRPLIATPKALAGIGVAALVMLPTLASVLGRDGLSLDTGMRDALGVGEDGRDAAGLLRSTGNLLAVLFLYPMPFLALFGLVYGAQAWKGRRRVTVPVPEPRIDTYFLMLVMLFAALITWTAIPVLGVTQFRERWMPPVLMALPLFLFLLVETGNPDGPTRRAAALWTGSVASVSAFAASWLVVMNFLGPPFCGGCRIQAPFPALGAALRQAGFERGTIVARHYHSAGNLLVRFPTSRVVKTGHPIDLWPDTRGGEQCLMAWRVPAPGAAAPPEAMLRHAASLLRIDIRSGYRSGVASARFRGPGERSYHLAWRIWDEGSGDCR